MARVEDLLPQMCCLLALEYFIVNMCQNMMTCMVEEHANNRERNILLSKHLNQFEHIILVCMQVHKAIDRLW